jgi:hypothetical protein
MTTVLRELAEAQQRAVPREPTQEMYAAGLEALAERGWTVDTVWQAMHDAATGGKDG